MKESVQTGFRLFYPIKPGELKKNKIYMIDISVLTDLGLLSMNM